MSCQLHREPKKIAPFYFCNNFVKTALYFDNFWQTDTEVNLQQNCNKLPISPYGCFYPTLWNRIYHFLLIMTAYWWCMTTLAVSDKCISEWLSISHSLQDWGLVYWEAACLVWSPESCVTAARCSCARVVHWKVKVISDLVAKMQKNAIFSKTKQFRPIVSIDDL